MTFYLSAYRSQPAAAYLFARVRLSRKEIESDLQVGLMAREGDFLRLTQRGMQVMNSVLVELL